MKLIIKILLSPIVLTIDLLTWIFVGLISCSSILFRLSSGIVALLGVAVLVTYSVKNSLILLTIAFLVSPLGLPMIAVSILPPVFLSDFQSRSHRIYPVFFRTLSCSDEDWGGISTSRKPSDFRYKRNQRVWAFVLQRHCLLRFKSTKYRTKDLLCNGLTN